MAQPGRLTQLIELARAGDHAARECLLHAFTPLVSAICRQYIPRERDQDFDDLFSHGLSALDAAIDLYDPGRGAPFAAFARLIIRRRVIERLRRLAREHRWGEEGLLPPAPAVAAPDAADLAAELQRYAESLREHGLELSVLVQANRPRSLGLRHRLLWAGCGIARDPQWAAALAAGHRLPLRPLAARYGISPHTIRRWEPFLVAVALAFGADLPLIQKYLHDLCREARHGQLAGLR